MSNSDHEHLGVEHFESTPGQVWAGRVALAVFFGYAAARVLLSSGEPDNTIQAPAGVEVSETIQHNSETSYQMADSQE